MEKKSCFAITEPDAGADTKSIKMTAVKEGNEWVLNGEKTFITGGNEADFVKAELLQLAIPVGTMTELQWFFS